MTQQEFEQLAKVEVTFGEYEVINAMYMSDENMDKQTFVKRFMACNLLNYVKSHAEYIAKLRKDVEEQTARAMEAEREVTKVTERDAAVLKEKDDLIADLKGVVEHQRDQMDAKDVAALTKRAEDAERNSKMYQNWYNTECEKSANLQKRLDTIKAIIEL